MSGGGSPTDLKMVNAGNKAAAMECIETSATAQGRIEAREASKIAVGTTLAGFENGMSPDGMRRPGLFPIALDSMLEYMHGNPRRQLAADEYYHTACYAASIAGMAVELRNLLATTYVTDGITLRMMRSGSASRGVVNIKEAVDDGHQFRLVYRLRKH
eukprot:jgi/Tetstr1/454837/TSEL_041717.t1